MVFTKTTPNTTTNNNISESNISDNLTENKSNQSNTNVIYTETNIDNQTYTFRVNNTDINSEEEENEEEEQKFYQALMNFELELKNNHEKREL